MSDKTTLPKTAIYVYGLASGAHSLTPSTFDLIAKCVAKDCNVAEK